MYYVEPSLYAFKSSVFDVNMSLYVNMPIYHNTMFIYKSFNNIYVVTFTLLHSRCYCYIYVVTFSLLFPSSSVSLSTNEIDVHTYALLQYQKEQLQWQCVDCTSKQSLCKRNIDLNISAYKWYETTISTCLIMSPPSRNRGYIALHMSVRWSVGWSVRR